MLGVADVLRDAADDVPHIISALRRMELDDVTVLATMLAQTGRNNFSDTLKERGLDILQHRTALIDALGQAMREGRVRQQNAKLSEDFIEARRKMPLVVRNMLCCSTDPSTVPVHSLLKALNRTSPGHLSAANRGDVMQVRCALSPQACAMLRGAVDIERRLVADSVDKAPEHQLNLSPEALEQLIGAEEARKLWRLPSEFRSRFGLGMMRAAEVRVSRGERDHPNPTPNPRPCPNPSGWWVYVSLAESCRAE